MDYRDIIRHILKGDVPGHDFHGNQWSDGHGGFNPRGGGGRAAGAARLLGGQLRVPLPRVRPAAPRQRAAVPRGVAPRPAAPKPENLKTEPALKQPYGIKVLSDKEVASYGKLLHLGGAQNKGLQEATMKDGSQAFVKGLKDWNGISAETLTKCDIAAGKVGEAMGISIVKAEPSPDGSNTSIIMPRLNGKTQNEVNFVARDVSPKVEQQYGEMRFFDKLVGNTDRHGGNFMFTNLNSKGGYTKNTQCVGIDHSLTCGPSPRSPFPASTSELRDVAKVYNISPDRIKEMYDGLKNVQGDKTNADFEQKAIDTCVDSMEKAFPSCKSGS